jgi:hypothetical protein
MLKIRIQIWKVFKALLTDAGEIIVDAVHKHADDLLSAEFPDCPLPWGSAREKECSLFR